MADTIIIYNKPEEKMTNLPKSALSAGAVDLKEIGLDGKVSLKDALNEATFALVFDGGEWTSMDYMAWETLRINEALASVKSSYNEKTQAILESFVAGMNVKYQGKKSWVELLNELAKEIEA